MGTSDRSGNMDKESIGIIGKGFIGQVLHRYYPHAATYDIKDTEPLDTVLNKEIIFIAFNLVDNGLTSFSEISSYAEAAPAGRVFIIKSTFVPGTTDKLQTEFPQHTFIYNPEFLTELTAWEDFVEPKHPPYQILGVPEQGLRLVHDLFDILPDAPVKRVISPKDAEVLKHATNTYYALKVTWFNQLNDACEELDADYETVREIMVQNPYIGDSHSKVWHKGYRGYGGKCLSKDPKNFARVVKFPIINHIEDYNDGIKS